MRDLVEAMDAGMQAVEAGRKGDGLGGGGGPLDCGLFVTKHEVLMLKRRMGERNG